MSTSTTPEINAGRPGSELVAAGSAPKTELTPIVAEYFADLDPSDRQHVLDALDEELVTAHRKSDADSTRRAYEFAWAQYNAFCIANDLIVYDVSTVARYVAWLITRTDVDGEPAGVKWGTVVNRLTGINRYFSREGHPRPIDNPQLELILRGFKRILARQGRVAPRRVTPLRLAGLRAAVATTETTPTSALRDQALLVLVHHRLTARDIVALDWASYRPTTQAAIWRTSDGPDVCLPARPRDPALCPVATLGAWSRAMGFPLHGPMFPRLDADGRSIGAGTSRQAVTWSVRRWAGKAGAALPERQTLPTLAAQHARAAVALAGRTRLIDSRDRALLLFGWRIAVRRSNLADLVWGDLENEDEGIIVKLRWTKTNQFGNEDVIGVERTGSAHCPVEALVGWCERLTDELGREPRRDEPVFPRIDRHGRLLRAGSRLRHLDGEGIAIVIQTRAARAGLVGDFNGHSLRRGFITEAVHAGIPLQNIMTTSRHKSIDSLLVYVDEDGRFKEQVGVRLGL